MKTLFSLVIIAAIGLTTGCATTPKAPKTFNQLGQFSAVPLNQNTYRIGFQADQNMNYGVAEEITLIKAAQTAMQNGFQFFKVMDDPSNANQKPSRQTVIYSSPSFYPYGPYGYYRHHPGFWPDPFYDTPQVVNIDPIQISYTIQCYKDQKRAPSEAFDASLILKSLGPKYGLSATGEVLLPEPPKQK